MAQRGRPRKKVIEAVSVDHAKLLQQFEQEQEVQLEKLYKDLALIRKKVDLALTRLGFIDECENLAQAAFKTGKAYDNLDEANDKLQDILETMFENNDFDHYDDIFDN